MEEITAKELVRRAAKGELVGSVRQIDMSDDLDLYRDWGLYRDWVHEAATTEHPERYTTARHAGVVSLRQSHKRSDCWEAYDAVTCTSHTFADKEACMSWLDTRHYKRKEKERELQMARTPVSARMTTAKQLQQDALRDIDEAWAWLHEALATLQKEHVLEVDASAWVEVDTGRGEYTSRYDYADAIRSALRRKNNGSLAPWTVRREGPLVWIYRPQEVDLVRTAPVRVGAEERVVPTIRTFRAAMPELALHEKLEELDRKLDRLLTDATP